MSILTPLRSKGSDVDGPPKRSEVERSPLPVPIGAAGGGVGRACLGVGAGEEDLETVFLICMSSGGGGLHLGSISIAPSIVADTEGPAKFGEDIGGGAKVEVVF